jgi:hypothetical protein
MTFTEFDTLLESMFDEMRAMSTGKGIEYANNDADRLANFKEIANEIGVSAEVVCYVYMMKHMRAIASYVKCGKVHSGEGIEGRIRDAQLYLALLNGLIVEKQREEDKQLVLPGAVDARICR